MKRIFLFLTFLVALTGCSMLSSEIEIQDRADLDKHFEEYSVRGSVLIYDMDADQYYGINAERRNEAFPPGSTFTILHALIGLETGVLENENSVIPWDGNVYMLPSWNEDQTLSSAFQNSVVWYFQDVTRSIGENALQNYVRQAQYGNMTVGEELDQFWVTGDLRITMIEQLDFLRRLQANDLPFTDKNIATVKEIMILTERESELWRGKAGIISDIEPNTGWFIGWLETDGNTIFFVTLLEVPEINENFQLGLFDITLNIFRDLGYIE